ncbi:MAG: hypothetical protein DSM106950_24535 [Stigonema ocellatum SAG 48.90 = DSM 106950]|nr:hypothetical protein [Stigonema ocellatum SAG 48.90 = DSM 106950]
MAMPKLVKVPKQLQQERIEEERMHDVLLLVTHLVQTQEVTVKLMLDCLYDVGSVNLINKKLRSRSLNVAAKSIARMSKPVVKTFALGWIQKNVPDLITKWLHSQVSFTTLEDQLQQPASTAIVPEVQLDALSLSQKTSLEEIKRLRSQVRYLTGISVGAIAALVSTVVWVSYNPQSGNTMHQTTNSNGNMATMPNK